MGNAFQQWWQWCERPVAFDWSVIDVSNYSYVPGTLNAMVIVIGNRIATSLCLGDTKGMNPPVIPPTAMSKQ